MLEPSSPSKTFSGVRFALIGFGPIDEAKLRSKLVDCGGVDSGHQSQNCTHVIVGKHLYDDPICVNARNSGKAVVMGSWVDHSFEIGIPVDPNSVLYRPPKDMNGISGAENLIVCLTGYQRQDRDDIMTMVSLMGAKFSKPLVANKVTHLICYKFEGEKYELAKRMKRIKLVNHRWLEDCLREWKLLPESDYEKSGYELEMAEASARDSEDEAEDASLKQSVGHKINKSPLGMRVGIPIGGDMPKVVEQEVPLILPNSGISRDSTNCDTSKEMWVTPGKANRSHEALAFEDVDAPQESYCPKSTLEDASCTALPYPLEMAPESRKVENDLTSIAKSAEKFSASAMKSSSLSYSRRTPKEALDTKFLGEASSSLNGSLRMNIGGLETTTASDFSVSKVGSAREQTGFHEDAQKTDKLHDKESPKILPQKRSISGLFSSSKSIKVGVTNEASGELPASFSVQEVEQKLLAQNHRATELLSSGEMPTKDTSKDAPDEIIGEKTPERSLNDLGIGKTNTVLCLSSLGDKDKPAAEQQKMKAASRKTPVARSNVKSTSNQKGSLYLSKNASGNVCKSGGKVEALIQENDNQTEIPIPAVNSEAMQESGKQKEPAVEAFKKTETAEVVTNASEGKDCHEFLQAMNQDKLDETKEAHEIDLNVEAKSGGPETKDSSNKDSSKDKIRLEDDKSKTKQKKELAYGENSRLEKGEKGDFPTVKAGKPNVKEAKTSKKDMRQEENLKGNSNGRKDKEEKIMEDKENLPLCGGDQKSRMRKPLARSEAAKSAKTTTKADKLGGPELKHSLNKDSPEDMIRLEDDKSKTKQKKELASRENLRLEKGKKRDLPTVKAGKLDVKKAKKDMTKEKNPERNDAEAKDTEEKLVEEKNLPRCGGDQKSNMGKPLGRREAANSAKTTTKTDKKSRQISSKPMVGRKVLHGNGEELRWFIVSGHRSQRKEYQQIIKRLKGKCCRDSHQWSYHATHFVATEVRRTEKFFAAAASGSWILKSDYLADCNQAGKFLSEESYEWHKAGHSEDGSINFEAPRKWRLIREKTGHGAFYGMRIVIYGDCFFPSLETIKRAVKAGDGTILATSPPYTRFLNSDTDFAIVSPGIPRVDIWIQEFLRHEIPCVLADYLVGYVCKPGYALDKHVLYSTNSWAERSFSKLQRRTEEASEAGLSASEDSSEEDDIACEVCGSRERGEVMLICGDENGSTGCGVGTHIDCCDPTLTEVPTEDWFCPKCSANRSLSENPAP